MEKDWRHWHELGRTLETGAGVHRPSEFSALLSSTLTDVAGRTVLDAGCGAGLITIAALAGGARLAVNPPQRPESILPAVESHNRHLHTGAGADGFDTLRLVLANAAASEVRTTAAASLRIGNADFDGPWAAPVRLAAVTLPVHPAWGAPEDRAEVGVWAFRPFG